MLSRIKILLLSGFIFLSLGLQAQQSNDPIIEYILEVIAENQSEDFDYTELVERLNFYRRNPLNLNKASRDELQELVFLNPLQISNLLDHIAVNGKLIDILELQSIDGFDLQTIRTLLNFSSINSPTGFENFSWKNLRKEGRSDLMIRYGRILEEQAGFNISEESGRSRYLGTPDRVFTRYRFNYLNNLQFSLNLDKDAGEQFWTTQGRSIGPDFVSASLYVKDVSRFKKIVLGDFSLQFGQGLTLWSGLSFGKGADLFSIAKQDLGLRPYTSINEFSFFRGFATQINFGRFDFTPFISSRRLDAGSSLNAATNLSEITSLQISGLHRTPNELANKNRIGQLVYGGNLQYNHRKLSLGLTAYQSNYSENFAPGNSVYNQFEFTGRKLTNFGANYSYTVNNIYLFGEFAHSLNSGIAYINGAIASLTPQISALVFHRNYQKDYYSYFNQGISESSLAFNERGFFGGLQFKSGKKYEFNVYTDLFKFPWLRFRVDAPSFGHELFSQFTYTPKRTTKFILRYRIEEKQQNVSGATTAINTLETIRRQNYRFEIQYALNKSFSLRNRVEVSQFKKESTQNTYGLLLYQDVLYNPLSSKWSGNARIAYFNTEGFDTRIYAYENDVLYGFSIPGLQNKGLRFYLNGRYTVKRGVDLWLKYSFTHFTDLETIGSGLDQIDGNLRSEVKAQIRYQF
jgi:hypothetical protein